MQSEVSSLISRVSNVLSSVSSVQSSILSATSTIALLSSASSSSTTLAREETVYYDASDEVSDRRLDAFAPVLAPASASAAASPIGKQGNWVAAASAAASAAAAAAASPIGHVVAPPRCDETTHLCLGAVGCGKDLMDIVSVFAFVCKKCKSSGSGGRWRCPNARCDFDVCYSCHPARVFISSPAANSSSPWSTPGTNIFGDKPPGGGWSLEPAAKPAAAPTPTSTGGLFGSAPAAAPSPVVPFGTTPRSGIFAASAAASGGRASPALAYTGPRYAGATSIAAENVQGLMQQLALITISAMPAYRDMSVEEIRFAVYKSNEAKYLPAKSGWSPDLGLTKEEFDKL